MLVNFIACFIAVFVSTPLLVVGLECLIVLLSQKKPSPPNEPSYDQFISQAGFLILIPAHNEAVIIGNTLGGLLENISNPHLILVVADNCTDNTAAIARNYGVTVLERNDDCHRGKGFALDYGIEYLKSHNPPDVLMIMDADCWVEKYTFHRLFEKVISAGHPAQALYLVQISQNTPLRQRISGFAWLVKNKIRPLAINKIGLPVALTGTGMAFPWKVIEQVNIDHGNIVEDMQLGIDCALHGFFPVLCPEAVIYSSFPLQYSAEKTQRTRWEHGHLMTIFKQVPLLIKQGLLRRNWRLLGVALDLSVPPLSLLVLTTISSLFILAVLMPFIKSSVAFIILLISALFFALMLVKTWQYYGQDYLKSNELPGIPLYIFSKLSIYGAFIFKRQKNWIRTDRN